MNKMQSLSSTNLESPRGAKDRSKSNSKQRDNEWGAVQEHSGRVGQAGGPGGGNPEASMEEMAVPLVVFEDG